MTKETVWSSLTNFLVCLSVTGIVAADEEEAKALAKGDYDRAWAYGKIYTFASAKFTTFDNEYTIDLIFSTTQGSITVITGNDDFKNRLISEYSNLVIQ